MVKPKSKSQSPCPKEPPKSHKNSWTTLHTSGCEAVTSISGSASSRENHFGSKHMQSVWVRAWPYWLQVSFYLPLSGNWYWQRKKYILFLPEVSIESESTFVIFSIFTFWTRPKVPFPAMPSFRKMIRTQQFSLNSCKGKICQIFNKSFQTSLRFWWIIFLARTFVTFLVWFFTSSSILKLLLIFPNV